MTYIDNAKYPICKSNYKRDMTRYLKKSLKYTDRAINNLLYKKRRLLLEIRRLEKL